ncbi:Transcription elongation factor family protein, putative isoform 1 [Theobroma cacao]|uniref:Transcription elongation factor family protein, putative isoform 1 n=2 Tax=Theobroma cacao TaxID=3641 RepID=A0A061F2L1_THECC|nr:Transcription elongation factor family protein, putative isoform 1 [Theobroma cacao]
MAMKGVPLEQWRDYFRTANSDIFDIIDHAITVAALDCPKEFRLRRDQIAEKLFTCKFTRCSGCDRVKLVVPEYGADNGRGCRARFKGEADEEDGCEFFEAGGSKESKANSSRDDPLINQIASNYSYGEAEALTDEIEEESMMVGEVYRIKEILHNSQDESDSVLFDSLRRLQLMALTVDILKATGIGKAVNRVRKHSSKQIRHLAQTLIDGWKELVDEWVNAAKAIAEGTPESVNPSVLDNEEEKEEEEEEEEEEGLPSPPLDVGAFFATQPTSMELSQFFDGMDDDGNPRNSGEFIKNLDNRRKPSQENQNVSKRKQQTSSEAVLLTKDDKSRQMKRQEPVDNPNNKPQRKNMGSGRPPKHDMEQKANFESKLLLKSDKMAVPKKPLSSQQDKFKTSDDIAVQRKLEATKRKLQERYQQAENAKRKRTIQVMELHDLPKQGSVPKNAYMKPGNHNRQWVNGRR